MSDAGSPLPSHQASHSSDSRNSNLLQGPSRSPISGVAHPADPASNYAAHAAARAAGGAPSSSAGASLRSAPHMRRAHGAPASASAMNNALLPHSGQTPYAGITSAPQNMLRSAVHAPGQPPPPRAPAAMSAAYNALPQPHQRHDARTMQRLHSIAEQDHADSSGQSGTVDMPPVAPWIGQRRWAEGIAEKAPAPLTRSRPDYAAAARGWQYTHAALQSPEPRPPVALRAVTAQQMSAQRTELMAQGAHLSAPAAGHVLAGAAEAARAAVMRTHQSAPATELVARRAVEAVQKQIAEAAAQQAEQDASTSGPNNAIARLQRGTVSQAGLLSSNAGGEAAEPLRRLQDWASHAAPTPQSGAESFGIQRAQPAPPQRQDGPAVSNLELLNSVLKPVDGFAAELPRRGNSQASNIILNMGRVAASGSQNVLHATAGQNVLHSAGQNVLRSTGWDALRPAAAAHSGDGAAVSGSNTLAPRPTDVRQGADVVSTLSGAAHPDASHQLASPPTASQMPHEDGTAADPAIAKALAAETSKPMQEAPFSEVYPSDHSQAKSSADRVGSHQSRSRHDDQMQSNALARLHPSGSSGHQGSPSALQPATAPQHAEQEQGSAASKDTQQHAVAPVAAVAAQPASDSEMKQEPDEPGT